MMTCQVHCKQELCSCKQETQTADGQAMQQVRMSRCWCWLLAAVHTLAKRP
jgi:hypothetical protein